MPCHRFVWFVPFSALLLLLVSAASSQGQTPWPMFGGTPARIMANPTDKNIPKEWSVEEGKQKNIKWTANLGSKAYGGPVIAGGKVFVGTNNSLPRDTKYKDKSAAVIMAFDESDGKFLWQNVHEVPQEEIFQQFADTGLASTPAVEGNLICYVTPSCEVICAGTNDGKILWRYDMRKELKVVPFHCATCSPMIIGDRVYLMTSNGRGEDGKIPSPQAPSFIALDKKDGKLLWQNNLPGDNILEGQWSNPTSATVNGKRQIIWPGGDNYLYGFDGDSGQLIWKFNCNPGKRSDGEKSQNYMIATPAVHDNKVYIGLGVYPDHPSPPRSSHFLCVDITKTGDVSPKSLDSKSGVAENKDSALVWAFGGPILPKPSKGRTVFFGPTMSTAAIHDGLVYISELNGYLICLDAKTGQKYWEHDYKAAVWGSPYYVDGKVYQCTEDGSVVLFKADKKYQVMGQVDMEELIHGTPAVANGVLYITTKSKLFAIAEKK